MENIVEKIKITLSKALAPNLITELKADILKLQEQLAAPAPTPTPAPLTLMEAKTKDGKILSYEGELKEGTAVTVEGMPAPNGDHELEDGTVITIAEGLVTMVKPVTPVDEKPMEMAQVETKLSAQKSAFELQLSEQTKSFNTKIDELSKIVLSQAKMIDAFINTPVETVLEKAPHVKSIDEMTEYEFYKHQKEQSRQGN